MLAKIHKDDKGKSKESEHEMPKNAPYKHKGGKVEFSIHKPNTSSKESSKHHRKQQESRESSFNIPNF